MLLKEEDEDDDDDDGDDDDDDGDDDDDDDDGAGYEVAILGMLSSKTKSAWNTTPKSDIWCLSMGARYFLN